MAFNFIKIPADASLSPTIEKAVNLLTRKLESSILDDLKSNPEDMLQAQHFGLGTLIGNQCGLWSDKNAELFAYCDCDNPAYASGFILLNFRREFQACGR